MQKGSDYSMAAHDVATKVAVNIMVNNGTTPAGNIKLATISLGTMSINGYDPAKVLTVSALLEPCLAKAIQEVRKVETSSIMDS